jgi:hypothetical protein
LLIVAGGIAGFGFEAIATVILCRNRRNSLGWLFVALGTLAGVVTIVSSITRSKPTAFQAVRFSAVLD